MLVLQSAQFLQRCKGFSPLSCHSERVVFVLQLFTMNSVIGVHTDQPLGCNPGPLMLPVWAGRPNCLTGTRIGQGPLLQVSCTKVVVLSGLGRSAAADQQLKNAGASLRRYA